MVLSQGSTSKKSALTKSDSEDEDEDIDKEHARKSLPSEKATDLENDMIKFLAEREKLFEGMLNYLTIRVCQTSTL